MLSNRDVRWWDCSKKVQMMWYFKLWNHLNEEPSTMLIWRESMQFTILFQDGVFFITLYYSKIVYFYLLCTILKKKFVSFILCKNKCLNTECSMRMISVKGESKKCSDTKLIAAILKSEIEC